MYESLTSSIIESIADHKDVDPDELDIVLAEDLLKSSVCDMFL